VKSGDNLGFISEWYNVRISDIKRWNRLRRNTIYGGQKLIIYVPNSKYCKFKDINKLSFAVKQRRVGNPVPSSSTTGSTIEGSSVDYILYTVKSGDTLWEIAQQFPGVSDTDIMRLNNIQNASKIKPGQRLKIKKKI
jgi:membrane-bound lytic murein transglycosylase D